MWLMTEFAQIIQRLDALQGDMRTSQSEMGTRLDGVRAELQALRERFDAQPDFRLLMNTVNELVERVIQLGQDVRMIRSAINDQARESVTPGEVEGIHHDLRILTRADLDHAARIRRLKETLSLPLASL
jgi:hypothetical protein